MNGKTEATLDIVAALLVLFSAMRGPKISLALAIVFLVALAIYKFVQPVS